MIHWNRLVRQGWLQHAGFWSLSTYVLFRIFNQAPEYYTTDLIYTLLFQISLCFVVYSQLWLLIPWLLKPGRYLLYLLGFAGSIYLGALINQLTFDYLADRIFPDYYFISYYRYSELMQFMLVYAVSSTLFKLSKSWFDLQYKEQLINRLEREKLDAELQALRAQLDPHFLFNSLNNVYSLALDADEKVPTYLLRLSDNLRYILYECKEKFVPLTKELEYIRNYLELQRLKVDPATTIGLDISGEIGEQKVAPLLFIPFIENSFKHGLKGRTRTARIEIEFCIKQDQLRFRLFNTVPAAGKTSMERDDPGGIGLENVQKRLKLLYPRQHRLQIKAEQESFEIILVLDLLRNNNLTAKDLDQSRQIDTDH